MAMEQASVHNSKKIIMIFILFINISCKNFMYNENELSKIIGVKVDNCSEEYSYEESSGFQGEGFLINKYLLNNQTTNLFINSNNVISYPLYDDYKEGWELVNWNKGYVLNDNILTLLSVFKHNNDMELQKELENISFDISDRENYVSLFYKDSIEDPYSVEIYILNPKTNIFWVINIST